MLIYVCVINYTAGNRVSIENLGLYNRIIIKGPFKESDLHVFTILQ